MEVTEAPKKIYVRVKPGKVLKEWNNTLHGVHDIEYIRTDVFIERAISWIDDFNNKNGGCYFDGWKKDFKDYMKRD